MTLIYILIALFLIWIFGDFIYSRAVAVRIANWEKDVARNEAGVIVGCDAFEAGQGETAILFVHGINDTPLLYRDFAPLIAESGYHCRVMRLPGFGESTDRYAASKAEDWNEHLKQEIHALSKKHDKVFLCSHSLGAALSIDYVLNDSPDIDGLILLAPAIGVSNARSPVLSPRAWHEIARRLLFFTHVTESPYKTDAHDADKHDFPERIRFLGRSTQHETFRLLDANRGRAGEIEIPLMIAFGKHDQVVNLASADEFFAEVSADLKEFNVYGMSAHALPVDFDNEQLARDIVEFIARIEAAE